MQTRIDFNNYYLQSIHLYHTQSLPIFNLNLIRCVLTREKKIDSWPHRNIVIRECTINLIELFTTIVETLNMNTSLHMPCLILVVGV